MLLMVFSQSLRTTTNKKELAKTETYSLIPLKQDGVGGVGVVGNTTGGCKIGKIGNLRNNN